MPNEGSGKLKLLQILDILNYESDEDHILTISEISKKLHENGIEAERRSIIRDIKILIDHGYDISTYEENNKGYYIRTRIFEEYELRLIIDAIQSSKFITKKKSKELIDKIKILTSKNIYKSLKGQVYIENRFKSVNEQLYYTIDKINRAIYHNCKLKFKYYTYNTSKKLELYRGGHEYKVSPYFLVWEDNYYYLICNYEHYNDLSHLRVDRMCNVELTEEKRVISSKISELSGLADIADYENRLFNMYAGVSQDVELVLDNSLINVAIDKFGQDVFLTKYDENHFKITAKVIISAGLISWVMQFGSKIWVLYPEILKIQIISVAKDILNIYSDKS